MRRYFTVVVGVFFGLILSAMLAFHVVRYADEFASDISKVFSLQ